MARTRVLGVDPHGRSAQPTRRADGPGGLRKTADDTARVAPEDADQASWPTTWSMQRVSCAICPGVTVLAAMAAIIVLGLNFVLLGDAFGIPVPFLDG